MGIKRNVRNAIFHDCNRLARLIQFHDNRGGEANANGTFRRFSRMIQPQLPPGACRGRQYMYLSPSDINRNGELSRD